MANRREFFKSFTRPLNQNQEESILLIRPPYGKNESAFQSKCPSCNTKACATFCDEKIIVILEDGTPSLDFSKNGCTFCDECAKVCSESVLSLDNIQTADKINAIFHIDFNKCVAHEGVICHSCKEPCIDDAILFNGMFNPIIDENRCTGCGFCISRCPTQAINYKVFEIKENKEQ